MMDDQTEEAVQGVNERQNWGTSHNRMNAELIIAEYNALRDEILRQADRQVQSVTIAVIALGTLVATGTQFKSAALIFIYPLLASALAAIWAAEDRGIQATGAYIWKVIEEKRAGVQNMSWEHFVANNPGMFRTNHRNAIRLYFVGSAIAAIILGISIPQQSYILTAFAAGAYLPQSVSSDDVLLLIAVISVMITFIILYTLVGGSAKWRAKITKEAEKEESGS